MRWALLTLALVISTAVRAEGYDPLEAASPAAEVLMSGKAHDWRRAEPIVKDRLGDMIFQRGLPRTGDMSPDDVIACVDDIAIRAEPTRTVAAMIRECAAPQGNDTD